MAYYSPQAKRKSWESLVLLRTEILNVDEFDYDEQGVKKLNTDETICSDSKAIPSCIQL